MEMPPPMDEIQTYTIGDTSQEDAQSKLVSFPRIHLLLFFLKIGESFPPRTIPPPSHYVTLEWQLIIPAFFSHGGSGANTANLSTIFYLSFVQYNSTAVSSLLLTDSGVEQELHSRLLHSILPFLAITQSSTILIPSTHTCCQFAYFSAVLSYFPTVQIFEWHLLVFHSHLCFFSEWRMFQPS